MKAFLQDNYYLSLSSKLESKIIIGANIQEMLIKASGDKLLLAKYDNINIIIQKIIES